MNESPFLGTFNQLSLLHILCLNYFVLESPNVQCIVEGKKKKSNEVLCSWSCISVSPFHLNVQIVLSSEMKLLLGSDKSICEAWLSHEFLEFPASRVFSLLSYEYKDIYRPN